jgi:hypothetical protein
MKHISVQPTLSVSTAAFRTFKQESFHSYVISEFVYSEHDNGPLIIGANKKESTTELLLSFSCTNIRFVSFCFNLVLYYITSLKHKTNKQTLWPLGRERTIPTERSLKHIQN